MAGGKPDQVEKARRQARAAGIDDVTIFAGERPAEEMPAYLLACDVLVSPRSRGTNTPLKIYQYLRSGKPIVATRLLTHTQVLSDETAILTGASPREFADGIIAALQDPARAAAVGDARARAGGDQVQLRRVSRPDAPGVRGAAAVARRRRGRQGRRVSKSEADALQLHRLRRSGHRADVRPAAVRRADRGTDRREQGRVLANFVGRIKDRVDPRRRHRHRAGGADAGPRRRPRHRRRRVGGDAGGRASGGRPRSISPIRFLPGDVHRLEFGDRAFDVVDQPARADARGGLAPVDRRAVPRRRPAGDHRLSVDAPVSPLLQSLARRVTHALGARTEPYRVLSDRRDRARARSDRGSACVRFTVSSSCRLRCTRRSDRRRFTRLSRTLSDRLGLLRLFGITGHARRRTVRRSSHRRDGVHRRPPGARAGRRRASGPRAGARDRRRRRRPRAPPGSSSRSAICATPRSLARAVAGVEVVYNIAAIYRQAGVPAETYRAVNATAVGELVEQSARAGVRRVVHCSTVGVHGDIEHPPANEDAPLRPGDIYQRTKVEGEERRESGGGAIGHRGHDRAAERHLRSRRSAPAEAVPQHRFVAFRPWAAAKSTTISPTSTISSKAFDCAASIRPRPIAPTSWPAAR